MQKKRSRPAAAGTAPAQRIRPSRMIPLQHPHRQLLAEDPDAYWRWLTSRVSRRAAKCR